MTVDNEGNNKVVKKKAKIQAGTTTATTTTNGNATAKKKKTKGRAEKASIRDNDVPKKKKTKGQGAETGNDSDIVKKKKKTKTRTGLATEKQDGAVKKKKGEAKERAGKESSTPKKKKSKNQNDNNVKKNAQSHVANTTGNDTKTKKKKMKTSAEKAIGNSNDTSGLPQYVTQSTSSKVGDNQSFNEDKKSRRKSILCIAIPVILLLLCIIAGVVVWQLGIFQQKTVIPKTTARMVVLEVTERKLTPLEINQDNIFGSGGAEEQALPGK